MAVTRIPLPNSVKTSTTDETLEMSLAETELTVRVVNCLEEKGILTIKDLLNCTREQLLQIPNFGDKTLDTVYEMLAKLGFRRGPEKTVNLRDGNY